MKFFSEPPSKSIQFRIDESRCSPPKERLFRARDELSDPGADRIIRRGAFIEKLFLWPPNFPHGQLTSLVELILGIARLNHTPPWLGGRGIWHGGSAEPTGTCQVPGLNQHIHEAEFCAMCGRVATFRKNRLRFFR